MSNKFVVVEGLDGAGITTQATLLRNTLIQRGFKALLTKEPTDGLIGGLIKACLRGEWQTNPLTLQTLYAADRAHHLVNEIEPAIRKGVAVICDRYILSSLIFGSLSVSMETLKRLNEHFRKPDVTVIIDTQPSICIERMKKARHHVELFEQPEKLEAVRRNMIALKGYFPNTHIVDGNRSAEEIMSDVTAIVTKYLK